MTTEKKSDFPFPTADRHDAPADTTVEVQTPSEEAIDQGVAESFPASDPVSVTTDKAKPDQPKPGT